MAAPARTATIRAFRGLRYDAARVDLVDVVAPPYDVIDDAEHVRLLAQEPHNVVRLILPDHGTSDARTLLDAWQEEGVLARDDGPCLYLVEQEFTGPDGVARVRRGFIGLVGVEDYAEGGVLPHERTHDGPVEGRLALLRATRTQLSPIFLLFHDPDRRAEEHLLAARDAEPFADVVDHSGTRHRAWRVPGDAAAVAAVVAAGRVTIADGHHRYETAVRYRRERPDDPAAAWTLAYLAAAESPGLQIFPTHRAVADLPAAVVDGLPALLEAAGFDVAEAEHATLDGAPDRPALVALRPGRPPLLAVLRAGAVDEAVLPGTSEALRRLDVTALGELVLPRLGIDVGAGRRDPRIAFAHRVPDAVRLAGADGVVFVVRAPDVADVEAVSAAGDVMPQKSTYFFPKTIDGIVFYPLDGDGA